MCSPLQRLMHNSPSPPLRGRCRRQRGVPCLLALSGRRQPTPLLSLCDISPRKGGRGESEDMHQSLARGPMSLIGSSSYMEEQRS